MIKSSFFSHFLVTQQFLLRCSASQNLNKSKCVPHHNATFLSSVWTNQSVVILFWRAAVFRNSVPMLSKAPQNYKSVNGRSYLIKCSLTTSREWQYLCCSVTRCGSVERGMFDVIGCHDEKGRILAWTCNAWQLYNIKDAYLRTVCPFSVRRQIIDSFKISFTIQLWCLSWTVGYLMKH
jgi:hypothetical protein